MNLDLTVQAKERLEKLRDRCDAASFSEVIRKALAALDELTDHQNSGGQIILKHKDPTKPDESLRLM